MRRGIVSAGLLGASVAAIVSGCAKPERASPAVSDLSCTSNETVWQAAFASAEASKCANGLEERAATVVSSCPERWEAAWAQGQCRLLQGDRAGATAAFDEGLARARKGRDESGTMLLAVEVGRRRWKDARKPEEAEALFREAIGLAEKLGRRDIDAAATNNLAGVLFQSGRLAESARAQQGILDAPGALDDRRLAPVRYNYAVLIQMLGNRDAARLIYEDLRVGAADATLRGQCAMRLAVLEAQRPSWDEARRLFEEARTAGSPGVDLHQGLAELEGGFLTEASALLARAVENARDPLDALVARMHLAQAELQLGFPEKAEPLARRAVLESDELRAGDPRWRSRLVLGRVLLARRDPDGAIAALRESVAVIRGQGASLRPADLGLRYLVRRSEPYAQLAAALAERDGDRALPEVLALLQDCHARALQEGLGAGDPVAAASLPELQSALPPRRLLLGYLVGGDRGVAIAVTHETAALVRVPGLATLREPLDAYRAALQRPLRSAYARLNAPSDLARGRRSGEALYAALLAPFEARIGTANRVDFVLDRDLALVPPSALPIPDTSPLRARGGFLGDAVETALVPLFSSGRAERVRGRPVLVAGDPEPDVEHGFPRLPRAAAELDAVEACWKPGAVERLAGPRLRRAELDAMRLDRFGLLHFATHAVASSRDPSQCAVVLSGGERLSFDQVLAMRLDDALVVLSACRTGEGEVLPGEGVVGLSWAFLRAGAWGVVVSLWSVDDDAASKLMQAFHRRLRAGDDPVAALTAARREVASASPHPAYWAPFEIVLHP